MAFSQKPMFWFKFTVNCGLLHKNHVLRRSNGLHKMLLYTKTVLCTKTMFYRKTMYVLPRFVQVLFAVCGITFSMVAGETRQKGLNMSKNLFNLLRTGSTWINFRKCK